jgi:hypothetical protein
MLINCREQAITLKTPVDPGVQSWNLVLVLAIVFCTLIGWSFSSRVENIADAARNTLTPPLHGRIIAALGNRILPLL